MKNKILLTLLLCAIPVASLRRGGHQNYGDRATSGIAFLLPQIDVDFSDLDARDAQNYPVRNRIEVQDLTTLFRENLVNLMVFENSHLMVQDLTSIVSFSYLFNKRILLKLYAILELLEEAILTSSRRFVHNGDKLCITFSVGIFSLQLLVCAFCFQRTPKTVNLRC
jgi:hypothetical protein